MASDNRGIDFIFGLPGNPVLNRAVDIAADDIRTRRALAQASRNACLPRINRQNRLLGE